MKPELLNFSDRLQIASLNQRMARNDVITANIANSETPGYRALGLDFEEQLQDIAGTNKELGLKTSSDKHLKSQFAGVDGSFSPEVYVVPTETIPEDGNTVDVDAQMAQLAENQILYRATVDLINRKIGSIRYAITGGR